MPQADALYRISPVADDRPAPSVAKEVLNLFRQEYKYSISDLCRTFCCSRDWIEDHVLPEVRHIHLNHFFKMYVIEQSKDLTAAERFTLLKGHYFFSDQDLARFWSENACAMKKTALVDLYSYSRSLSSRSSLAAEKQRHSEAKNSSKERNRHLNRMQELLSDTGYELYYNSLYSKFEWIAISCPSWQNVKGLLSSESIERKKAGYNNHTQTIKTLSMSGATKIKVCGKTLWIKPQKPSSGYLWPIPVQAEATDP